MSNKVIVWSTIEKLEEKFVEVWVEGFGKDAQFETKSLGWFVQFTGSSESINLWDTAPDWVVGDSVAITFERKPR